MPTASAVEARGPFNLDFDVGASPVDRTERRFVEEGLEAALREEPRPGVDRRESGIARHPSATDCPRATSSLPSARATFPAPMNPTFMSTSDW